MAGDKLAHAITIRTMLASDINFFACAFSQLNWGDRTAVLAEYLAQQQANHRDVLVAEYDNQPAGYVTLLPNAAHGPFANRHIPEIKDLNVLPPYRRHGIGNTLLERIEAVAKAKSNQITLAVGMYADYGAAQRLYVKRGYIPDGTGLWQGDKNLAPYEPCINSDDLNLYFIKNI